MAPNSPESPSKKRKQPINGPKRDQPLFAGRRQVRALQQPPDFFTDSLNTSYLPSPSPSKGTTRQDARAKPRQVLGSGRSLAPPFSTSSRPSHENKRPVSGSTDDRKRAQERLKPRPTQASSEKKKSAQSKQAQSLARTRTPTPPRGRQPSIASPSNSESSPGRGYAEAYQRIVEEENLAHEDSIEDMENIEGQDDGQQNQLQEFDRSRLQRLQHSTSPTSLKASRRASSRSIVDLNTPAMDNKENMEHESDSESGIDLTENITDSSLGSGSSQYAKDLQRLSALKSGAKAFSKARMGERVGLTVENLQRRNGSNESLGSVFSAGSFSNRGSDPSVNVPKAWGRKAKPGNDWLARINSRSGRFTGDVPKRHSSGDQILAENERREWSEPIDQWISSAAEVPLPSSEDGPSENHVSPQRSNSAMAITRSKSVDRRRQWEFNEDEFTGRSLQVSESPPIRLRNAALDRIREREMETLEKRAVTTSRLGELREKSSGESLRRIKSNKSIEDSQQVGADDDKDDTLSGKPSSSPKRQHELQETGQDETPEASLHDEGESIPDTPVVIYKNTQGELSYNGKKDEKTEGKSQNFLRPSHERKDSHDLLKRLARVTSQSPSPSRGHMEISRQNSQSEADEEGERTPQPSRSAVDLKTPVITGAWVDQTLDETLQLPASKADLKTPLVTGAWIDTPLPTGGRGPPMPTPSDQEEQKELNVGKVGAADLIHRLSPNNITARPSLSSQAPLKYSGPPLAKSALEEILNDIKSTTRTKPARSVPDSDSEEDPTLHLGESTIQSLEELIANDEDFSTLLAPTPPSPQTTDPSSDPSPSSQALTTSTATTRSSRLTDLQSYSHLLSRLTTLAPSLRASSKRIQSLERAVSTVPTSQSLNPRQPQCNEAGELHDFIFPCQTCGCPGGGSNNNDSSISPTDLQSLLRLHKAITTITLPIPRLWYWRHPTDRLPRLTWLGIFTILAYMLYLCESYARFKYCHPLYAYRMEGYGVDINAPKPPFVAVKVLYRYTAAGTVMAPFYHAGRITLRILAAFVGWVVGVLFDDGGNGHVGPGAGARGARQPVSRDMRIPRPRWGPDLSLMDDEYL